jgi:hypothetical protein
MRRMTASVCSRRAAILAAALLPLWMLAIPHDALALTTQEVEQIVEEFFPQELIDESQANFQRGGPAPFRARAFALADLDGTGTANYIVAAYTNGVSAAIRVLRVQGNTATLAFEPINLLSVGIYPAVELVDIENDGRPELAVHFSGGRGTLTDWVFKWTGTELRLIGPFSVDEHGNVTTDLFESSFFDVDGDGILEIVQSPPGGPTEITEVYKFDGQTFSLVSSQVYFETFYRQTATPVTETRTFQVLNPGSGFVLTIINGNREGDNRVSSGTIKLNGVVVMNPNDLNQQVRTVVRQVIVLANNVLEVELAGKPTGQILVTIEPPPQ